MTNKRSNSTGRIVAILFIAFVVVSGVALAASGNLNNPFRVVTQLTGGPGFGREERGGREGQRPPGEQRGEPGGGRRGPGGEADGFNWNDIGSVLGNIWFILAASAVVMVVGPVIGLVIRKLRGLTTTARPAAA